MLLWDSFQVPLGMDVGSPQIHPYSVRTIRYLLAMLGPRLRRGLVLGDGHITDNNVILNVMAVTRNQSKILR